MKSEFNKQLKELKNRLVEMGKDVEKTINLSINALKSQDLEQADKIIKNDDKIDSQEMELKEECRKLLAYDKIPEKDLRTILAISEAVTDLERIGDYSENIAEMVIEIGVQPLIKPLIDIPRMTDLASNMLTESLDIFMNEDLEKAKELARDDEMIDDLNEQIFRELITHMMEKPTMIRQASSLIFISRFLERIGDHCTNICEGVIYMISGRRESY